jgi:hypothetical protein
MQVGRKEIGPINFADMTGGVATAYPAHAIADNQVFDTLNAVFEKYGCSRAPGYVGIKTTALFTTPLRGWFVFKLPSGAEVYLAVTDHKLYTVNLVTGAIANIYTLTADTECFGVNYGGKFWIVNGTDQIKVESATVAYRIGIVAPVGFTASATGTGTVPAGVHKIFATYTRKVNGTSVLESAPFYVGAVTSSGTDLIRIAVTASTDPQVTNVTFWITDAGGADYYYYGQTTNTTGNFDISSDAAKNVGLLIYEQAAGNQLPPSLTTIYAFAGRLWGTKVNNSDFNYSILSQNVYDLERWPTENHIPTIPFVALSFFGVGSDLYINTVGGPYRLPNADTTAKPAAVIQGAGNNRILFFPKTMLKTVQEYNDIVYGFTNDGFRSFDGAHFSIDLSKHIKPQVDAIMNGTGDYNPVAVVFRRSGKRTEYQVSYRDVSISTNCHNRSMTLNLDAIVVQDNLNYNAPWEFWSPGFGGGITTSAGLLFVAQFTSTSGTIAQQIGVSQMSCFDESGTFVNVVTAKRFYVRGKTRITELAGIDLWQRIYFLATLSNDCTVSLLITEESNIQIDKNMKKGGGEPIILDGPKPIVLPFILPAENPINAFVKMPMQAKGNSVTILLDQTADDEKLFIYKLELYGTHERNIYV